MIDSLRLKSDIYDNPFKIHNNFEYFCNIKKVYENMADNEVNIDEESMVYKNELKIKLNKNNNGYNGELWLIYNKFNKSLTIHISSIPKLLTGTSLDNLITINLDDTIDKLKTYLDRYVTIDFRKMKVKRLDLGINFPVKEDISKYTDIIYDWSFDKIDTKIKKHYNHTGLMLHNKSTESILFYDKLAKEKKHDPSNCERYIGKNLMRYEVQMKSEKSIEADKRLGSRFLFEDLFAEIFLERSKNYLSSSFENICNNTNKFSNVDMYNLKSRLNRNGLERNIMKAALVYALGNNNITINNLFKELGRNYQPKGIRRLKKQILELSKITDSRPDLINELAESFKNEMEISTRLNCTTMK